jgi:hypothetical protein
VSELTVRQRIKTELEKQKSFEMDKKTLRRIIENLKRDGLLLAKDFKVTIKPYKQEDGEGQMIVKTLLLAPDCKLTDEELMRDN